MRQKFAYGLIAVMLLSTVYFSLQQCSSDHGPGTSGASTPAPKPNVPQVSIPEFDADSAYVYTSKQVKFGPRVPNTDAHQKCGAWIVSTFKNAGLTVIEQKFKATHYKGTVFDGNNIIAQYKPEIPRRILIMTHWDSRFIGDKDTDPKTRNKPIDAADDGASGVGVMLEMARALNQHPCNIGVDFICIDVEDQGDDEGKPETWCLGSQYWAQNLHKPGYMPYQAVLLDMVGGKGAKFYKEGLSMEVGPQTVDKIWALASASGFGEYFVPKDVSAITDDHYFVIKHARIPMIDIISMPNSGTENPFPDHHHTHADNMTVIDKNTLKAVGQTMLAFIYQTYNGLI